MRGNGYASTLVHELGMKFLSSGRPYMTLSTQVGDPAERIYQKLGYRPVDERISVVFG
jgi:predicted GNAT family acetyltransferase